MSVVEMTDVLFDHSLVSIRISNRRMNADHQNMSSTAVPCALYINALDPLLSPTIPPCRILLPNAISKLAYGLESVACGWTLLTLTGGLHLSG